MELVYKCDYCNNFELNRNIADMVSHEQLCSNNPVNKEKLPNCKIDYNWLDHEIEFFKNNMDKAGYVEIGYPELFNYIPRYIPELYFKNKDGSVLKMNKSSRIKLDDDINDIFRKVVIQNKINGEPDYD